MAFSFDVTTLKKQAQSQLQMLRERPEMAISLLAVILLIVGVFSAVLLSDVEQDIRQQASVADYNIEYCTTFGATTCIDGVRYRCESPGTRYAKIEPEETCSRVTCSQSEIDQCRSIGRTCRFDEDKGRGQCASQTNTCTSNEIRQCEAIDRICIFDSNRGRGDCIEGEDTDESLKNGAKICGVNQAPGANGKCKVGVLQK